VNLNDYFEATWKARGRLLDAAEELTKDEWRREFDFSWKSVQKLFAHIIEVERSWIAEDILRGSYKWAGDEAIEQLYATPALTRDRGREVADQTRAVLAEFVPGKLKETREGKDIDGNVVPFTVEQILTHVFTHELRHQGQLQAMLRLLGKPAPNADWI
jgi:uncharacterized damage-inducible protein DinB